MTPLPRPSTSAIGPTLALSLSLLACGGNKTATADATPDAPDAAPITAEPSPVATASADPATAAPMDAAAPESAGDLVTSVAWQPRGPRVALARGLWVSLVDPAHPGDAVRLGPHRSAVRAVGFSDDGAQVATRTDEGMLQIWSAAGGAPKHTLVERAADIHAVAFSHDGRLVAASVENSHDDRKVPVWDTTTGARLPAKGPAQEISAYWALAFLPDNRQLAGFDAMQVVVWDVHTGKRTGGRSFETGATSPLTLSPDGTHAAVSLEQHRLVAWPLGSTREVGLDSAQGCEDHLTGIHFSPDAHTLLMHSASGRWASWNVPSLSPRSRWRPSKPADQEVGFMSEDGAVVVRVIAGGSAEVLDAYTGRKIRALEGTASMEAEMSFSPDHRWVVQGGSAPAAWEVATGRRVGL